MNNEVIQKLWFNLEDTPPKNIWGRIPKKYRDNYAKDKDGNWFEKKRIGFLFTQYAWFMAFDIMDVDPSKFDELDQYDKHIALCYGAAKYWCMKNGIMVYFTKDELEAALKRNSLEDNEEIVKAQQNAVFSDWMKSFMEEEESPAKKK